MPFHNDATISLLSFIVDNVDSANLSALLWYLIETITTLRFLRLCNHDHCKAPAKRSQQADTTCRNIVERNMLHAFGHRVATCCDMLAVVGSNLKGFKLEPTKANMSKHGGQTHATCCAQQCCDMLCWHVAIVWPGLNELHDSHLSFQS